MMEELKTIETGIDTDVSEEEASVLAPDEVHNTEGGEEEAPTVTEDWEKRCLMAEAALEDSLEFATLFAAEGGSMPEGDSLRESDVYRRFCELRALGLSVKEAFSAADSAREKKNTAPTAGKDHLRSTHTARRPAQDRLMGEELTIAKNLLGEDYSYDELLKLYRRVAK